MPLIRSATAADGGAIWETLESTFRAGETYTVARDIAREDALAYWLPAVLQWARTLRSWNSCCHSRERSPLRRPRPTARTRLPRRENRIFSNFPLQNPRQQP